MPTNFRGLVKERGQSLEANPFLRLTKAGTDYRMGAGDIIRIEIVGQEALSEPLKSLRIAASGDITIPFAGPVKAAGRTAAELEGEIQTLLEARQLIKRPEALVYVLDYQAKPIYILGEVDNPGEYVMSQDMTLTEALLMAGGMEQTGALELVAGRYGFLHRRTSEDAPDWRPEFTVNNPGLPRPGRDMITVDLEPLRNGRVLEPDILLRTGDVFIVPRRTAENFYVVGDVRSPGAYEIPGPSSRSLLLTQAVARAGGANMTAKLSKGMMVRYENGKRVERPFDLKAVLRGKQPDMSIRGNDIIFIPGSKVKTLQYGLLGIVPQATQNRARTASEVARDR